MGTYTSGAWDNKSEQHRQSALRFAKKAKLYQEDKALLAEGRKRPKTQAGVYLCDEQTLSCLREVQTRATPEVLKSHRLRTLCQSKTNVIREE